VSEENNQIIFTAADIEKYHKGLLSAKEMHNMEKAALDDPFLEDALEGYAFAGADANADLAELKKRLSERTERTKVIPIARNRHNATFPWLRVAAIVIVIAGAGLITYEIAFTNKSKNIAQIDSKKAKEIKSEDSTLVSAPATNEKDNAIATITTRPKQNYSTEEKGNNGASVTHQSVVGAGLTKPDTTAIVYSLSNKSLAKESVTPEKNLFENTPQPLTVNNEADKKELAKEIEEKSADEKESVPAGYATKGQLNKVENDNVSRSSGIAINRQADNQIRNNIFRGQITDANNNPVPFANISNTQDNIGTYSDAKGYFNLTSPDSILNVEVRSIGFENNNAQLRNNVNNNQVVMQDDSRSLSEVVVISNRKPNAAARSRDANRKIEEPEPADGWNNYYIYLANNLNIPDEIKTKEEIGNVEVSLEVDKNGNPTNIKVEKSLCEKCDKEAIRLIKEGPKWNHRIGKGRAVVTIPFSPSKN